MRTIRVFAAAHEYLERGDQCRIAEARCALWGERELWEASGRRVTARRMI
jgi:hypothetical protein